MTNRAKFASLALVLTIGITGVMNTIIKADIPAVTDTSTAFTFYSTWTMQGFDKNNLDKLYNSSGSWTNTSWYDIIHDDGCVVASYAMILNNLGAKTTDLQYDVRDEMTYRLSPDPFTVTYANAYFPTISYSDSSYWANYSGYPVTVVHSQIATSFGKTAKYIDNLGNYTDDEKADLIAYLLERNPEGIACFYGSRTNNHTIVFTDTTHEVSSGFTPPTISTYRSAAQSERFISTPRESNLSTYQMRENLTRSSTYGSKFTVCDPSNSTGQRLFQNSWTASNKGWSSLYRIVYFD